MENDWVDDVRTLINSDDRRGAIKLWQEKTGIDREEAMNQVDALAYSMNYIVVPHRLMED